MVTQLLVGDGNIRVQGLGEGGHAAVAAVSSSSL